MTNKELVLSMYPKAKLMKFCKKDITNTAWMTWKSAETLIHKNDDYYNIRLAPNNVTQWYIYNGEPITNSADSPGGRISKYCYKNFAWVSAANIINKQIAKKLEE